MSFPIRIRHHSLPQQRRRSLGRSSYSSLLPAGQSSFGSGTEAPSKTRRPQPSKPSRLKTLLHLETSLRQATPAQIVRLKAPPAPHPPRWFKHPVQDRYKATNRGRRLPPSSTPVAARALALRTGPALAQRSSRSWTRRQDERSRIVTGGYVNSAWRRSPTLDGTTRIPIPGDSQSTTSFLSATVDPMT